MFVAYEAIAIIPENLIMIKTKLGSEVDQWEDLLMSRLNLRDHYYIIFDIVGNLRDSSREHVVVTRSLIDEMYEVAKYTETKIWITKKN